MATLKLTLDGNQTEVLLGPVPLLIGRDQSCGLMLPNPSISRRHAMVGRFGPDEGPFHFEIRDLASRNGVDVNGMPVAGIRLCDGDEIALGPYKLVFKESMVCDGSTAAYIGLEAPGHDVEPVRSDQVASDGFGGNGLDGITASSGRLGFSKAPTPRSGSSTLRMEMRSRASDAGDLEGRLKAGAGKGLEEGEVLRRLMIMYRLSGALSGILTLEELLDGVLGNLADIVDFDRAFIFFVIDPESGDSGQAATSGSGFTPLPEPRVMAFRQGGKAAGENAGSFSKTIIHNAVESGEGILTTDAIYDDRFDTSDSIALQDIRSSLCVPLSFEGRSFGAIYLDAIGKIGHFKFDDLELLTAVSTQVSTKIHNVLLIERLDRAYRTLKANHDLLIESEKLSAIGKLASGVAHEISNPLSAVVGLSEMLCGMARDFASREIMEAPTQVISGIDAGSTALPDDAGTHEPSAGATLSPWGRCLASLETIRHEAELCRHIAKGLLHFSRRTGCGQLTRGSVNDTLVMARKVAKFHRRASKLNVRMKLERDIPPVLADLGQLQQVFLNLIMNAFDAMGDGGTLEIATRSFPGGMGENQETIEIAFRDEGCGVAEDIRERIFEPLFTTKPSGMGTGLGLSIVSEIVKRHGGSIALVSEPGAGAEFIVSLPAAPHPLP